METEEEHIYSIVFRHVHAKTTNEDLEFVQAWNMGHPEESIDLEELSELNILSNSLSTYSSFPIENAWQKSSAQTHKSPTKRILFYRWSSAAVFLLAIIAAFLFRSNSESADFVVSGNEASYLILEDETEVYLSENASVRWNDNFLTKRELQLSGEAFFHVAKMDAEPFVIEVDHFRFTVLGTSFRIEQKNDQVMIRMREGKLQISSKDNPTEKWYVEGKETVVLGKNGVVKLQQDNEDLLEDYSFRNEKIVDIFNSLNKRFPDLIRYNKNDIQEICTLTANFEELTLLEILEELRLFFDLDYKIQNGKLIILHLAC
jgi:ferric-dicitrate binding protein FerR (iron transport regulator)